MYCNLNRCICSCCPSVTQGPVGPQGPIGPEGPIGPQGMQGDPGSFAAYAEFYANPSAENEVTIAPSADVKFPQDGPNSATDISRISNSSFNLEKTGAYLVFFEVSTMDECQLVITLNDEEVEYTIVGKDNKSTQLVGMSIVVTTSDNTILTIRNPSDSNNSFSLISPSCEKCPRTAHLIILAF